MSFLRKYNTATVIHIPLLKAGATTQAASGDWTPVAGDVKIQKDGGGWNDVTNLPTATAVGNGTVWSFSLTATELQAAVVEINIADAATKAVEDDHFQIETFGNASANLDLLDAAITSRLAPTVAGRTIDLTAGGCAGIDWANLEAPTTTIDLSGTTVKTATDVEAKLPAALVGGRIDASVGAVAATGNSDLWTYPASNDITFQRLLFTNGIKVEAADVPLEIIGSALTPAVYIHNAVGSGVKVETSTGKALEIANAAGGPTVSLHNDGSGAGIEIYTGGAGAGIDIFGGAYGVRVSYNGSVANTIGMLIEGAGTGVGLKLAGVTPMNTEAADQIAAASASAILEEAMAGHTTIGTLGALLTDVLDATLGTWKIETVGPDANRLIFYKADGVTVLKKFDLLDDNGAPTVTNPFQRIPL